MNISSTNVRLIKNKNYNQFVKESTQPIKLKLIVESLRYVIYSNTPLSQEHFRLDVWMQHILGLNISLGVIEIDQTYYLLSYWLLISC